MLLISILKNKEKTRKEYKKDSINKIIYYNKEKNSKMLSGIYIKNSIRY